jgi:hypothetical protein
MLKDVLKTLTGYEMAAVLKVLDAVAPRKAWSASSTIMLENLQAELSKEKLKERNAELMKTLQLKYHNMDKDEITYLCLRHCLNFVQFNVEDLP